MIIKNTYPVAITLISAVLVSCTWSTTPNVDGAATQNCTELRQQIISNNYSNNTPDQHGNSPTVAARLYKDYAHYNCPTLVEENKDNPLPATYRR